jgi:Spy/CpxP family protein refolding chaperone
MKFRTTAATAAALAALVFSAGPAIADQPAGKWHMAQGYGMGPGMMGGYGPGYGGIDLSEKQREQLGKIQQDIAKEHWELMGKMHDEQYKLSELYGAPKRDDAAIEKSFKRMEDLRRQMFDSMADARRKMDGVLTPEQKERAWRSGPRW